VVQRVLCVEEGALSRRPAIQVADRVHQRDGRVEHLRRDVHLARGHAPRAEEAREDLLIILVCHWRQIYGSLSWRNGNRSVKPISFNSH